MSLNRSRKLHRDPGRRVEEQNPGQTSQQNSGAAPADEMQGAAHDLFFRLFNANPIPTALARMEDGVILNVNEEFIRYFDVPRERVIGKSREDSALGPSFEPQLGFPTREEFVNLIKSEGRIRSYETSIERPSGEVRNILASAQYVRIEGTDAVITAFVDITERVQAEQQIRELAAELAAELTTSEQAERHRLSQILHDDLQQRIFAIQMQLSFLRDAYEKNDLKAFSVDFPQIEDWLAEAIRVTRRLSVDLSPPVLHGEGLVESVLWLAAQVDEQYGLKVKVELEGKRRELDEKIRVVVFYALRELLFNIVKHAETSEAAIRFDYQENLLRVIVRDGGIGFDSADVVGNPKRSHGLLIIRHRLHLLGCSMDVNSQPGKGTEVIVDVPYVGTDGKE